MGLQTSSPPFYFENNYKMSEVPDEISEDHTIVFSEPDDTHDS